LTDVITPKIPVGATVIIHGHTDAIGEETYNQILSSSCKRCENIIENVYLRHRNDVKFELNGFGENENKSPFENKTPRTILIERL
jgi:outer membrane protein OmpA-like peptidoglycan-associated protein